MLPFVKKLQMKQNDVKVGITFTFERTPNYVTNTSNIKPIELNVLVYNNTKSNIKIDKICIMVKSNFIPSYKKMLLETNRKYEVKPNSSITSNHDLGCFINKYGISRLFLAKIWTNIGIIKSDITSIECSFSSFLITRR